MRILQSKLNPNYRINVYNSQNYYLTKGGNGGNNAIAPCDCPRAIVVELYHVAAIGNIHGWEDYEGYPIPHSPSYKDIS